MDKGDVICVYWVGQKVHFKNPDELFCQPNIMDYYSAIKKKGNSAIYSNTDRI